MYIRSLKTLSFTALLIVSTCYSGSSEFVSPRGKKANVSKLKEDGGRCMGEIARLLAHVNKAIADVEIMNIESLENVIENSNDAVFAGAKRTEAHDICGKLEQCKKTAEQILHLSNQLAAQYQNVIAS